MLGSNQRRLSRRFYSPSLLAEADGTDQHIRRSRRRPARRPSAICPCAPGLGHGRGRKKPRTGPMGAVTLTIRPASSSDLAFQDTCSLSPSPHRRARDRTKCLGCRGPDSRLRTFDRLNALTCGFTSQVDEICARQSQLRSWVPSASVYPSWVYAGHPDRSDSRMGVEKVNLQEAMRSNSSAAHPKTKLMKSSRNP